MKIQFTKNRREVDSTTKFRRFLFQSLIIEWKFCGTSQRVLENVAVAFKI